MRTPLTAENLTRGRVYVFVSADVQMATDVGARNINKMFAVQANGDLPELECSTLEEIPIYFFLPRIDKNQVKELTLEESRSGLF